MHVVEHIGLGRYGDPINAKGSEIAILELKRILKRGGLLYFVVPVGRQRTVFHAHRIFSPKYILEFFADCTLEEFSLIDDAGAFAENIPLEVGENQDYGCGCFLIRKNTSA
jgi:SAM-dependent methyltransferase